MNINFVMDLSKEGEVVMKSQVDGVIFFSLISLFVFAFAALAYSGIHLAA